MLMLPCTLLCVAIKKRDNGPAFPKTWQPSQEFVSLVMNVTFPNCIRVMEHAFLFLPPARALRVRSRKVSPHCTGLCGRVLHTAAGWNFQQLCLADVSGRGLSELLGA